jgi:hypothetical protein
MATDKLQEAITLIKAGDKKSGQTLLLDVLDADPKNEDAWLWLTAVVPEDKRALCLKKALSINPNNTQAKQYLGKLAAGQPSQPVQPKIGGKIKPRSNTDARLSGLFIFVLGAGLGYWQIILPIMQAVNHARFISYSAKATVLAPLAMLFGMVLLVFGAKGLGALSKPPTKLSIALILIFVVVLSLGCGFGMEFIMKGLGYH